MGDDMLANQRIWPVILSGGSGTRLWPLSRTALPKQLLPLAGPESMIVTTAGRVADRARFHPPLVVTGPSHAAILKEQLGDSIKLLLEPQPRNTAPAIALALLAIEQSEPDALIIVMPSDHGVARPDALLAGVAAARSAAAAGWLITFGIAAGSPETGYGYIRSGAPIGEGVCEAAAFIEKPDRARALTLLAEGGYSWNSGIFLFSIKGMRRAMAAHAPAVLAAAETAMAAARREGGATFPDATAFAASPSISIDNAVFELAEKVAVCQVNPGWSDIGSWDALYAEGTADTAGNVASGRVVSVDATGCLLRAEGTIISVVGVNDLNIIATPDAVLVTARGRAQDVRAVAAQLAGDPVLVRPVVQQHAWGEERVVHDGAGTRVRHMALNGSATLEIPENCGLILVAGGARRGDGRLVEGQFTPGGGVVTGEAGAVLLVLG